jgi:hypothetical protein
MASYPGECKHDRLLAITVVPWISEWLIYYELWLVTGRWLGGGHTVNRRLGGARHRGREQMSPKLRPLAPAERSPDWRSAWRPRICWRRIGDLNP